MLLCLNGNNKAHMYQQLCMKMHDAWCTFSMSVTTLTLGFKPLHAAVIHVGLFFIIIIIILRHACKQIQVLLAPKKSLLKRRQQSAFLHRGQ